MDTYATVVGFFQDGGPFMYPIAMVLAVGVAIACERWFYLSGQSRSNRRDFDKILPLLKQKRQRELDGVHGPLSTSHRRRERLRWKAPR